MNILLRFSYVCRRLSLFKKCAKKQSILIFYCELHLRKCIYVAGCRDGICCILMCDLFKTLLVLCFKGPRCSSIGEPQAEIRIAVSKPSLTTWRFRSTFLRALSHERPQSRDYKKVKTSGQTFFF